MPGLMAPGYDRLYARNRTPRTVAGYQPSPGDENLSGPGAYAVGGLAGRMNNYQAQQNYGATGYMPSRTVGGAYGLQGGNPDQRLTGQQVLAQASGNQYAPMGLAAAGNPGGRFYGGAMPGMVGGQQARTGGGATGAIGAGDTARADAMMASRGYAKDPLGTWRPGTISASTGGLAAAMGPAGIMGAPGPAGYVAGAPTGLAGPRGMDMRNYRLGIYQQRQQNRVSAQQAQMEASNPQYGLAMARMRQQGQLAQQGLGLQQQQLTQQGDLAREGLASRERVGGADREQRMALAQLQTEQQGYQRAHEAALASGNHSHAAAIAQAHDANLLKMQELQGTNQLAGINAQGAVQRDIAKETHGYQRDTVQLQREQLAQQRSDSLRAQAQAAYQSGDIQGGQRLEQQATAAMGGGLAGGAPVAAGAAPAASGGLASGGIGRIPPAARSAVDATIAANRSNPRQLVQRLRGMGMSDQQINIELSNAYGQSRLLGLTTGGYTRHAGDPGGWGLGHVDPATGNVRYGPFGMFGGSK